MSATHRICEPRAAEVRAGPSGVPAALGGIAVDSVREEWVVEDRWWTARPLRRHYYEVVLDDGRLAVVFCDLLDGSWHRH
jgi:hypothetical protein